jgi:hypothetical protein
METTQLKPLKIFVTVSFVLAGMMAASTARATTVENVDLTLQNGSVFSGTLTFSNSSLRDLVAVNGTLTGYLDKTLGQSPDSANPNFSDIDDIDEVVKGTGLLSGLGYDDLEVGDTPWQVQTGTTRRGQPIYTTEQNVITLVLDISNPSDPTLIESYKILGIIPVNNVSGIDLSSGSPVASDFVENYGDALTTPEPSAFMLLGSGLLGLAGMVRRRIGPRG